jgi:hypothetical protein
MPTTDQIVQVPFIGGVDEYTDPDQLQPPSMATLTNCVVRKPGRIEKRAGFHLLAQTGTTTTPATVYGGTQLPASGEALGAQEGQDGSKLLVAAGSNLYEYVGSDATHGYRQINKLPACYGTLHPVDATGGDVTEVEVMLNIVGTHRCCAWVSGWRSGQELTDDTVLNVQPAANGGLYIAVQRVDGGEFVTAPVRIPAYAGGLMSRVTDLRMARVLAAGGEEVWVVAYREDATALCALIVNASTGAVLAPQLIQAFAGRPYVRSFDVTAAPGTNRMLWAICQVDSTASNADVGLSMYSVNATTGAFTQTSAVVNYLASVNATAIPGGVYTWSGFAARGVVLETSPSGQIGIAVRAVYKSTSVPFKLDGKMIVGRVTATQGSPTPDVVSVTANQYGVLHRIGFKSDEDAATAFLNAASTFLTGGFNMSSVKLERPGSSVSPFDDEITLTVSYSDSTVETFSATSYSLRSWTNITPYLPTTLQRITASGLYTKQPHLYPGTSREISVNTPTPYGTPIPAGEGAIFKQQITFIRFDAAKGVAGASLIAGQTVKGYLRVGGSRYCTVVMSFAAGTGYTVEAAIWDGNPGKPVAALPSYTLATDIEVFEPAGFAGIYPFVGGGTPVEMVDDLNSVLPYTAGTVGVDVASQTSIQTQVYFDSVVGPELCVHRWDVKNTFEGGVWNTYLALSSTSAGLYSNPNGDQPLGYVSPFAENNFFEVYEYGSTPSYALNAYNGGATQSLVTALGGPWRLIGGLQRTPDGRFTCVLSPSGDDFQRSAFLVSFSRPAVLATVDTPKTTTVGLPASAEGYKYANVVSPFVESVNMPRVAAVPLNTPRLMIQDGVGCVGAIRQGQTVGGSQVFSLQYTYEADRWRAMRQWGDYTIINGGTLSAFDGTSCAEVCHMLWPQLDLTSVAYDRIPTKLYNMTKGSSGQYSTTNPPWAYSYASNNGNYPLLFDISRPFFAYEAGFNSAYGDDTTGSVQRDMGWSVISTSWGGSPTADYQTVYSDPRLQQITSNVRVGAALNASAVGTQHYYGRYQTGSAAINLATTGNKTWIAVWAPRASASDAPTGPFLPQSKYAPVVANGDFLIRWCYESVDGTGRVLRSAPSNAVTFTVCAAIKYNKNTRPGGATDPIDGGVVDEYRYGFFIPRLELTNRLQTAEADYHRVVVQPYMTAEPFATVFYRTPFSNFLPEYKTSFIVPRNVTRGVVPYSGTPAITGSQLGIVTNNFKCFDGLQGEYNGILAQPFLYTTGGVLDNVTPPSALCMTVHQNRLVIGGADDATLVWFSKELNPTDAPAFSDALTIQLEDGGPVTGVASLQSVLVIFKRDMTFIVPGDMPDDAGGAINRGYVSNALGTPIRMPHGIGCIDHRSVVETPVGVFFQSQRTIELLSRDMSIVPTGLQLDDTLVGYVVSGAAHNPRDNEVLFTLAKRDGTASSVQIVVYNYLSKLWAKHALSDWAASIQASNPAISILGTMPYLMAQDSSTGTPRSVVFKQSDSTFFDVGPQGRAYVPMAWKTAPLAVNKVQGYQRTKRIRVFGNPIPTKSTGAAQSRNPHGASFTLQTDYATSGVNDGDQTVSWTEAETAAVYTAQGREVYETHVAQQKGQALTLSYTETPPADVASLTHGYGTAFSNMTLVVGLKKGLDKRTIPQAKH